MKKAIALIFMLSLLTAICCGAAQAFADGISVARPFLEPDRRTDRTWLYLLEERAESDPQTAARMLTLGRDWMAGVSDERFLNEINMPGSHDAGMKDPEGLGYKAPGEGDAKTQHLYIDEQLNAGIRLFDVRLYHKREYYVDWTHVDLEQWDDGENLWVLHGKKEAFRYWGQNHEGHDTSLAEVLGWMRTFLTEHPTETVVLYIRPETESETQRSIIMERAKTILENELARKRNPKTGKPFLYMETYPWQGEHFSYPRLRSCRGQVVVRCPAHYEVGGIDPETLMGGGDVFARYNTDEYKLSGQEKVACIHDFYSSFDHDQILPESVHEHFSTLYDVWLNGTSTPVIGSTPTEIAEYVNGHLFSDTYRVDNAEYYGPLGDLTGPRYVGWVWMDAASAAYAKKVWQKNYYYHAAFPAEYNWNPITVIRVNSGLEGQELAETYAVYRTGADDSITVPPDVYDYDPDALGRYLIGWEANGVTYRPGDAFPLGDATSVTFTGVWTEGVAVSAEIDWQDEEDADGLRPETLTLRYAQGSDTFRRTVGAEDGWRTLLPWDAEGVAVEWSTADGGRIDPEAGDGHGEDREGEYRFESTGGMGEDWTLVLKHTPVTATVAVSGKVRWQDGDDRDEIRPESVTIHLYADDTEVDSRTVSRGTNWAFDLGDRLLYHDGVRCSYRVAGTAGDAQDVPGYTPVYDEEGFGITYVHNPDSTVSLAGTLIWDDDANRDGIRPESVTLTLLRDEEEIAEAAASEEGDWAYRFAPKEDPDFAYPEFENGEKIRYRVTCDAEKYRSELDLYDYSLSMRHAPAVVNLYGEIRWEGDAPEDRPQTVVVTLLKNGDVLQFIPAKADEWEWGFYDLYAYDDGVKNAYDVAAEETTGYTTEVRLEEAVILKKKQAVITLDFVRGHEAYAEAYGAEHGPEGSWVSDARVMWRVVPGGAIEQPSDPAMNGYTFGGWLGVTKDHGEISEEPYDFDLPVTGDLTLKPAWTAETAYTDVTGEARTVTAVPLFSDARTLGSGWYAVTEDVAFTDSCVPLIVTGDANLILCDGTSMAADYGIDVSEGNRLTIWGQAEGTGALSAQGHSRYAGIGGAFAVNAGDVVIHGGTVTATGDEGAAGIGGGSGVEIGSYYTEHCGNAGMIVITGGTVTAAGGANAAGIGGGKYGDGGTIVIAGGTVTAAGGDGGAGIGGASGENTQITLSYDADVSVLANSYTGSVTLEKPFAAQDEDGVHVFEAGAYAGAALDAFAGRVLRRVVTVTFDSAGGTPVPPQILQAGALASAPESWNDQGETLYELAYWYADEGGETGGMPYDFETPVLADLVLKAEWKPLAFGYRTFVLPAGMVSVAPRAFANSGMKSVWIGDRCVSLGDEAFADCAYLRKVRVPAGCELQGDPFRSCRRVYLFGTAGSPAETYCSTHDNCVFVEEAQE